MAGPNPGAPILTIWLESQVVRNVVLGDQPVTVGRLPDNGVVLSDQSVSRRHAEIRLDPSGLVVTDLGSAGGTFVGTEALLPSRPVVVPAGDPIRIGPFVLTWATPAIRIEIPGKAAPAPAPPESWTPPSRASEPTVAAIEAREQHPAPRALGPCSRYLYDLPAIFQDDGSSASNGGGRPDMSTSDSPKVPFLGRMLLIFETMWEPLEQRQNQIAMYYDPRTCPAEFLSWLASWLQLAVDRHWPEPRRRRLLREAMDLYRWRGTRYGLTRMIEVCTGITPTITENEAQPYTFKINVRIPPKSDVRRDFVEYLVAAHKPAHVGYILEFAA
jgi:phage tail-like protein